MQHLCKGLGQALHGMVVVTCSIPGTPSDVPIRTHQEAAGFVDLSKSRPLAIEIGKIAIRADSVRRKR